jgi:hypothetical protein
VRHLALELSVVAGQLIELDEVTRPALEAIPRRDELAVLARLAGQLPGQARIVPRARLRQLGV